MQDPNPNRKIILIALGVAAVVLLVVAIFFSTSHKAKPKPTPAIPYGTSVDKNNGDTLSNPKGKAPEPGPNVPTFTGVDTLVQYGMTEEQLKDAEQGLINFNKTAQLFSVVSASILVHPQDSSGAQTTTFDVQVDYGKTYNAHLISTSLTAARLVLYDKTSGAQIFDSGVLDVVTNAQD